MVRYDIIECACKHLFVKFGWMVGGGMKCAGGHVGGGRMGMEWRREICVVGLWDLVGI